jgi:hypothetical protein
VAAFHEAIREERDDPLGSAVAHWWDREPRGCHERDTQAAPGELSDRHQEALPSTDLI